MPPPPKPGVIPLRPLNLGDVLGGAFSALGRHWKQLLGMALVAYGIAALVVGGAVALAVSTVHDHLDPIFHPDYGVDPARSDVQPVVIAAVVVFVVALAMWLVAMAVMYSAAPAVLQEAVLGRRTTFGAVWRKAWSRFPAVLGTLAIQWGAMLGAVLLFMGLMVATVLAASHHDHPPVALLVLFILGFLALVPVGMWLWVRFGFAPAAAVLENQRPIEALRRSAHLVKDAWWRTFGILIVVGMISAVIGYFVQLPFTYGGIFAAMPLALSGDSAGSKVSAVVIIAVLYLIGTVISQFLSTTLPQLAAGLLYVDQRIRRENLAAALAEAAGVPSAEAPPTGGW
ncbi:DUF7847 domain-containing protein [Streptomyces sp. NBC_01431]|uniref:DUF7847 domain-containing protein n=1 Tax=Streptomyces sp. NBC_01431 TaxID=2903863 RepID=UPI002E367FC8|nr:hypothetical protein [Streptomyces sp. NBC_01431]